MDGNLHRLRSPELSQFPLQSHNSNIIKCIQSNLCTDSRFENRTVSNTHSILLMVSFHFCLNEEKEEEEELTPFSPPPTLSITEEILEFINQSRAREGLAAIHTHMTVRKQNTHHNLTCGQPRLRTRVCVSLKWTIFFFLAILV